jgi:hypothetical protein
MELEHSHSFAHDEACQRMRALTDYLSNKHGMQVEWTGADTARICGKYTVVSIDANVRVEQGRVRIEGKDPGFLWRAPAKKYIATKLEQYLNAAKPVAKLPRG